MGTAGRLKKNCALAVLLLGQSLCMMPNLLTWAPVWDEPGHLASGLSHWKTLDFRPYSVNPPLCRMLAAIPGLFIEHAFLPGVDKRLEAPGRRSEFRMGRVLMERDPEAALFMLRAGRGVAMLWPLAGTLLLFFIGCRVFGEATGWISAASWAFNPMVLAHGVLIPPDIPAAIGLMFIAIATAMWLRNPGFGSAVLMGLSIGFGVLTKSTLIISYPVVLILGIAASKFGREAMVERTTQYCLATIISLFTINVGYVWTGSFTRLGDFVFASDLLNGNQGHRATLGNRFGESMLGKLPVPLPADFVTGMDVQYSDFERGGFYPYLAGKWDRDGFLMFYVWYYLLKMPTGALLLFFTGLILVFSNLGRSQEGIRDRPLLIALSALAIVAFWVISSRTDHNFCQRYSLVSLPLFCLLGGSVWVYCVSNWQRFLVLTLIGWSVLAGVKSVPNSLSYYNEIAGGVSNGKYMLHGNATDWGQDGLRLGRWCQRHPDRRPLSVATTGFALDLGIYGIDADSIRFDGAQMRATLDQAVYGKPIQREGWHLVSIVHLLYPESPYFPFRYRTPVEWIGQTHAVFYVDNETARQWLDGTLQVLPPMRGHENEKY